MCTFECHGVGALPDDCPPRSISSAVQWVSMYWDISGDSRKKDDHVCHAFFCFVCVVCATNAYLVFNIKDTFLFLSRSLFTRYCDSSMYRGPAAAGRGASSKNSF